MSARPPLVLCSATLGSAPLGDKLGAAAAAGFEWVSVYGDEYHRAIAAGVDVAAEVRNLGLRVAEVDGVAVSLASAEGFIAALEIARDLAARSITIVETGDYDPDDPADVATAVARFGEYCDVADDHGILVHIEPFAWSNLGRTTDAARIVEEADRGNGGLLLDYWHHVRGPDQGVLDSSIPASMILEVQLADTLADPWVNVRDECMTQRQEPGRGHGDLPGRLRLLAARGPLPPVGIELFGATPASSEVTAAARTAHESLTAVLTAAGL